MTNCVNCGAILHGSKCEYCGTEYNNNGFQVNFAENDYIGVAKLGNQEFNVYIDSMEFRQDSDSWRDVNGFLHRNVQNPKRKFTLVEI